MGSQSPKNMQRNQQYDNGSSGQTPMDSSGFGEITISDNSFFISDKSFIKMNFNRKKLTVSQKLQQVTER